MTVSSMSTASSRVYHTWEESGSERSFRGLGSDIESLSTSSMYQDTGPQMLWLGKKCFEHTMAQSLVSGESSMQQMEELDVSISMI